MWTEAEHYYIFSESQENTMWSTKTHYVDSFYYLHADKVFRYLMINSWRQHTSGWLPWQLRTTNHRNIFIWQQHCQWWTVPVRHRNKIGTLNLNGAGTQHKLVTNKCCSRMCSKILPTAKNVTIQKMTRVAKECLILHCTLSSHRVKVLVGLS